MTAAATVFNDLGSLALGALRAAYRTIRPALGGAACRFHPTCSEYALQAVHKHGVVKGTGLAARRLARCHPLPPGGYDPVP